MDLIAEGGVSQVTKRAVCARAKLNDRYFYEHFTDRDALLEAVAQDLTAQGLEAVVTATLEAGPDIRAQIHAAADAALVFMTVDPRRGQLLESSRTSDVVDKLRVASTRMIARAMTAMAREVLAASAPTQLDSDVAAFTMVSGVMELVAAWLRGEFETSREHLADLIAAMLLAITDISATLPLSAGRNTNSGNRITPEPRGLLAEHISDS